MDLPQLLLLLVILVIATLLVIIGLQIISLLKDTKNTLHRLDKILADLEFLLHHFTRSTSTLSQVSAGLQSGLEIVSTLAGLFSKKTKKH